MRRKMLIATTLIFVMLLNCIAPILQVHAATEKTTMTFNTPLYKALKSYFEEKVEDEQTKERKPRVKATYNDIEHTIKMETATRDSITELSLKEKGIEDISGLEYFQNVSKLILSANNLSEESNLDVLNELPKLSYLDLSSNKIKDVSEIQDLIMRLLKIDTNAINLSGQMANIVIDVSISATDENSYETFDLPQILQIAGIAENGEIKNKGSLKAEWFTGFNQASSRGSIAPSIVKSSIPNPVTESAHSFKIQVGSDSINNYVCYEGLIKEVINIKDTGNGSYNTNPASKNILKDSIFTLFFVVHRSDSQGIIFKDRNLYLSVKEQLTAEQTVNKDLISYPYDLTVDGETYYDICDYELSEAGKKATLKIDGQIVYTIENFGTGADVIKDKNGREYDADYEIIIVDIPDSKGIITRKQVIKIAHKNEECRNLYVDAYDEPQALVITDLDLINKISSLILNDQQIVDLDGLEFFIGLDSKLNVSFNYIKTLAIIYALEINKGNCNNDLVATFRAKKDSMQAVKSKVITAYNSVQAGVEAIKAEIVKINDNLKKLSLLDTEKESTATEAANIKKAIEDSKEKINGELSDELNKALNDAQKGLNPQFRSFYQKLYAMYTVFNNEYKLTSILAPELNYVTEQEYEETQEILKGDLEGCKNLVKAQASKIETLEKAGALSSLEQDLIVTGLGLGLSEDEEYPISQALNERVKQLDDDNATRSQYTEIISKFLEINVYSLVANYCLLERMNNETASAECYAEKYLLKQIKEYEYEGIDATTFQAVYNRLTGESASGLTANLYTKFENYIKSFESLKNDASSTINVYYCKGQYREVTKLGFKINKATKEEITDCPTDILLTETVEGDYTKDGISLYMQLMTLANKFTAVDEIDKFVKVPSLKSIDVRNNEIESIGDTEVKMVSKDGTETVTTENLASLKSMKELYAGHNFVSGDIDCVNWSELSGSLKKLDLSYNYIKDILPLEVLEKLRYLDVSDNLLEGKFNLKVQERMPKLKDLILAGNKYSDISLLIEQYEFVADGNLSKYFAREDTLNIDLSRQKLEVEVENIIPYNERGGVYEVELPPIFSQLEYIDAQRNAFGITSSKGTITASGGVAYIPVNEKGDFEGVVTVVAKNGFPEDITTSMGINTTCTIKYSVKDISVDGVVINEDITRMERGTEQQFTATVNGSNIPDTSVEWDLTGNESPNTTIDQNGVVKVAADETAENITIIATSIFDDTKEASNAIELFTKTLTEVTVNEQNARVEKGKQITLTATVTGENLEEKDKEVTWKVEGNSTSGTTIDDNGILTVSPNETAETLTVTATSKYDTSKSGSTTVTIFVKSVTEVVVSSDTRGALGDNISFTADVRGENLEDADKTVKWSVFGNGTPYTYIDADGRLTIGTDETAEELTVVATSEYDQSKIGTAKVDIVVARGMEIKSAGNQLASGDSMTFTAIIDGSNLTDEEKEVTWEVIGATDEKTTITSEGVLTIGADEAAKKVTVKASLKNNPSIYATKEIRISSTLPTLGYNIDENDETVIVGVSPSTNASNFKAKLVTDNRYTLKVTRNGAEVADDTFVATGDIVTIYYGDAMIETYEIVVKGDVNGDGVADALDSSLIKAHRAKLATLTGLFLRAADIDDSGDVSIRDVRLLLYHRARIDGYIL